MNRISARGFLQSSCAKNPKMGLCVKVSGPRRSLGTECPREARPVYTHKMRSLDAITTTEHKQATTGQRAGAWRTNFTQRYMKRVPRGSLRYFRRASRIATSPWTVRGQFFIFKNDGVPVQSMAVDAHIERRHGEPSPSSAKPRCVLSFLNSTGHPGRPNVKMCRVSALVSCLALLTWNRIRDSVTIFHSNSETDLPS